MELKLYNTLTRRKEVFKPLDPNNVRMYVCGPTVYDNAHIGNARPVIVFDVLFRLLRHIYGESHVSYVRNITDIDDKIIARAHELQGERNVPIAEVMRELTERTNAQYQADVAALGCLPPTATPRATEYVPQMIAMIERLITSGHAYAKDGHVLYDVSSKADYGKLANRSVDEMIAGARVDVAPYKKGPMDFVLWKPSDAAAPGWESPWGRGRPGWHIECSAMSEALLGETFDIHGGGIDLVFPHHENEIAQSEGAHTDVHGHSKPLANYWMHNGFLQVEGEKMSKSLGNFVTIHDLLRTKRFGGRKWSGGTLKFAMLQTSYRQPIDWTVSSLLQSEKRLERWRDFAAERTVRSVNGKLLNSFLDALADDLNTPEAFSIVDRAIGSEGSDEDRNTVYEIIKLLGIKGKQTRVIDTTEKLQRVMRDLSVFSESDWRNMRGTITSRPTFLGGGLFPEAKLFIALQTVADFSRRLTTQVRESPAQARFRAEMENLIAPASSDHEAKVRRLLSTRDEARRTKDFRRADEIRAELDAMGIQLKDSKDPKTGEIVTTWELKR